MKAVEDDQFRGSTLPRGPDHEAHPQNPIFHSRPFTPGSDMTRKCHQDNTLPSEHASEPGGRQISMLRLEGELKPLDQDAGIRLKKRGFILKLGASVFNVGIAENISQKS